MGNQLEQVSAEAIRAMLDNLGQAKEFVLEQAPSVMREIVLLGRIKATVCVALGFFAAVVLVVSIYKSMYWERMWFKSIGELEAKAQAKNRFYFAAVIVSGMLAFPTNLFGWANFFAVWFAPKVYLLEQLGKMVK